MKITLKGELHPELTSLGLKPGDTVEATPGFVDGKICESKDMFFVVHRAVPQTCVVYPDNYDVVPEGGQQ